VRENGVAARTAEKHTTIRDQQHAEIER